MDTPSDGRAFSLAAIDALVLCGGVGTRLRAVVPDLPKGLAPVAGKPFLDILVDDLVQQGFRRIVFCVGHLGRQIIERYESRKDAEYLFSEEDVPLGTGGAVANALPLVRSKPFLVMNGDSLCRVQFGSFVEFHRDKGAAASLVLTAPEGRRDAGTVCVDETHKIVSFAEKSRRQTLECFVNAGIYLFQDSTALQKQVPFSLEYDVFPKLVKARPCFGLVVDGRLLDIGTPERYQRANEAGQQ